MTVGGILITKVNLDITDLDVSMRITIEKLGKRGESVTEGKLKRRWMSKLKTR